MSQHEDEFPRPRVFILSSALQKLRAYVKVCPVEINGLGVVKRLDNDFLITDIFILPQRVSIMSAKVDDEAFHKFIFELASSGRDTAEIKLQWHSHVNMAVFCSGEDRATISSYRCDFMISLVVNKQEETFCRIDLFQPFRLGLAVPLEIFLPPDSALEEICAKEVEEKVEIATSRNVCADFKELLKEFWQLGQTERSGSDGPS